MRARGAPLSLSLSWRFYFNRLSVLMIPAELALGKGSLTLEVIPERSAASPAERVGHLTGVGTFARIRAARRPLIRELSRSYLRDFSRLCVRLCVCVCVSRDTRDDTSPLCRVSIEITRAAPNSVRLR